MSGLKPLSFIPPYYKPKIGKRTKRSALELEPSLNHKQRQVLRNRLLKLVQSSAKELGLSQMTLANKVGICRTTLQRLLANGETPVTLDTLCLYLFRMGINVTLVETEELTELRKLHTLACSITDSLGIELAKQVDVVSQIQDRQTLPEETSNG